MDATEAQNQGRIAARSPILARAPKGVARVQMYARVEQEIADWIGELSQETGLPESYVIRAILRDVMTHGVIVEKPISVKDPRAENENHNQA